MPNQRAIMSVVNKKYIDPLKVMWASLFLSNSYPMDFYLFYEDLSEEEAEDLASFASRWPNARIVLMPISSEMLAGLPVTEEFPKEIYFKLLGLDFLPQDLERILCMDIDMAVKGDISPVFSLNISNSGIAACADVFGVYFGLEANNLDCLGLTHDRPYFNAGFMLFSLPFIRQIGGGKAIINLAHMHKEKLYYPEQDILNLLFHDSYVELPWSLYNCPPLQYVMDKEKTDAGELLPLELSKIMSGQIPEGYLDYTKSIYENACVVHYMGGSKPWKADREQTAVYEIFDRAYEDAEELKGF